MKARTETRKTKGNHEDSKTRRDFVVTNTCWQLEYSIDVEVSRTFAWSWRTDIQTWDDPPATFMIDGPFAAGTWGTTHVPGQPPVRWQIRDVRPGEAFTIDVPLDGAVVSFEWRFEAMSSRRTRMTQLIVLSGDNATAYEDQVRSSFGATLADGMKRIAAAIVTSASLQRKPESAE